MLLAIAASAEEGGSSLAFKHEYFWDRNGVWNHTPALALKWVLSRKWSFNWEQELDIVTGASRRLGADKVGQFGDRPLDGVSGASKLEMRHSENPGLAYSHKGVVAAASFYHSRENDYVSMSPAVSLAWDFNERNTTFGINAAEFFDDYRPRGAYAGLGGWKRIRSLGATLAQTLSSLTLVGITGNYVESWGYLGHPYNPPVDSTGSLMDESVPNRKRAGALAGQVVQGYHVGDLLGSINLDMRRFQDSWGIKSTTADIKLHQYFAEGAFFRLRLRYYNQTGASFAKEIYGGSEIYHTADIRFFPFESWLIGAKVSMAFPESWGESLMLPDRWDVKYDQVVRNTGGDPSGSVPGQPRRMLYQLYEPEEYYLQGVMMAGLIFDL